MKKLPNLDALRFIAAFLVLIFHLDAGLAYNHYKEKTYSLFPFNFGALGVVLFFVLSGFLITWLLLQEKERNGTILVKRFYLKRVLRIWPLYYLIILLSFLFLNNWAFLKWEHIAPVGNVLISTPLFIFLLLVICPNVALMFTESIGYANPTWSIGVEEQFYLLWPHVMKTKKPLVFIIAILIFTLLARYGLFMYMSKLLTQTGILTIGSRIHTAFFYAERFFSFPYSFQIDAMAIGALGAMASVHCKQFMTFIFSKYFQLAFYAVFVLALYTMLDILPTVVFSIFFILLILNLALNKQSIIQIPGRRIAWLGQISYGIYLFHFITIMPSIKLVYYISGGVVNLLTEIIMCLVSLLLTVGMASVSYKYFESPFLKMKEQLNTENNK